MTKSSVPTSSSMLVRVSGPQGLVAAVPQYLGFQPADSLVLLCLRAPRGRVGPVARIDLFPPDATDAVNQLLGCAIKHADSVAVICYHRKARPRCLDVLLDALREAEVSVTAVLSVSGGRIRQAETAADQAGDLGVPMPGPDDCQMRELAAASVLAGRTVLSSRQALRASIAAPRGSQLERARAAIVDRCSELAARLEGRTRPAIRAALTERAEAAYGKAEREHAESGAVSLATASELIVLSADITARDRMVAVAVGADDADAVPMLISVVGWCPEEEAAEICAVLAVTAYRYGDGALAQCAVDRTLLAQPDHRLAHLMLSVMAAGLPPAELAVMAEIGPDDITADAVDDDRNDFAAADFNAADFAGHDADDDPGPGPSDDRTVTERRG